ncbi:MAG TPA: DUF3373 family protein, partial [Nitrospirota bacterium]
AFADRSMLMDGTSGHVPQDNTLRVDYAYATVSNVFGAPVWFSIGRRPSTSGIPGNIRENAEKIGTAGIPNLLVDYAFDGFSLGYAPDIEALPGSYVKLCGGRGYSNGFTTNGSASTSLNNSLDNTDFLGLNAAIMDTDKIHAEVQYQKGMNIFDRPETPTANLGNIDWAGGVVMGKVNTLNLFLSAATSMTDPKGTGFMGAKMLDGEKRTGYAVYVGGRYDIPSTKTKVGLEYNHGSKYWVGFVPAGDDIWTSKLGARGDVVEVYLIQELNRAAISKNGKAFIRLGYQYYKFQYTGSNNWEGAPVKISDLSTTNPMTQQFLPPVENAQDLYLTFDVQF